MSHPGTYSRAQRYAKTSSSATEFQHHESLLAQSRLQRPSQASAVRALPDNPNITSYPSNYAQYFVGEPDAWQENPKFYLPPVTSPGPILPAELHNADEDTSHHESSFDEFLTNEASSDNPMSEHTTPQEAIWEQQFMLQDQAQPHILDSHGSSDIDVAHGIEQYPALRGITPHDEEQLPKFVYGQALISPSHSSSNSPMSLPVDNHAIKPSVLRTIDRADFQRNGISPHNLKVDTMPRSTLFPSQMLDLGQHVPPIRAPSPVVMVSDYEEAERMKEKPVDFLRSSTKRSRGSESSNDFDGTSLPQEPPAYGLEDPSSHLMPPGASPVDQTLKTVSYRVGVDPQQRNGETTASIRDIDDQHRLDERNDHVQEWLATSDAGSDDEGEGEDLRSKRTSPKARHRSRSHTSHAHDALGRVYTDKYLPGPRVLVEVESDDEYFENVSIRSSDIEEHTEQVLEEYLQSDSPQVSPRALEGRESSDHTAFPALDTGADVESEEPLPTQFIRRGPWQDPLQGPIVPTQSQPNTSNSAAYRFNQEAARFETSSRAATWGTRRRLSESEVASIVDGSQVRHLSLSQRGRERGASFLNRARGILPRRSSSNLKADPSAISKDSAASKHAHRSSVGTLKPAQRMASFGKPKSPSVSTGSALLAMTGHLAAVGRGNSVTQEVDASKSSTHVQTMKKQRSKSDVTKAKGGKASNSGGLADLMSRHGGPPVPTLASPMHEREPILAAQILDNEDIAGEDDDDELDELGVKMDLEIRAEDITPSSEGFRDHARKLNPRLPPFLIDRVGHEQIRRYKKLVESKIKHTRTVQVNKKCTSGKYCFDLGGEGVVLAPRASSRDPDSGPTQFHISKFADDEVDESTFTDGVVSPALFPPGIPLPPVQRLPAEFECNLCFKVKKFQKPSDWTKHVHEDIMPFSCTFPNCAEPKSFKRKADWVRHENERHRHLEWWRCSVQECQHICYRKDNFVQHLVREHKMPEPKVRRGSASSKNKPVSNVFVEDHEVWRLVDTCRVETLSKPREEPCRFCGNVCSTWKKLSVHMGKHMEQLAMPVLQLVNMREVSPETVISPVEQQQTMPSSFAMLPAVFNTTDLSNLSPYPTSATSVYQTSSAGQSPASFHSRLNNGGLHIDPSYYSPHNLTPVMQGQATMNRFGSAGGYNQSPMVGSAQQMAQMHDHVSSTQGPLVTPRSQPPMDTFYDSGGVVYGQTPLEQMYANQVTANMPPDYMQALALGQPRDSTSISHGAHSEHGLYTPMGQQQQHQYDYGGQGYGGSSTNMHSFRGV